MTYLNAPTLEEREKQIHKLNSNPDILTRLLLSLWIKGKDIDVFLDAWNNALYTWELSPKEYTLYKAYLSDIDFLERYNYFTNQSQEILTREGFSSENLSIIWEDFQNQIWIILRKFQVYAIVSNPDYFWENYVVDIFREWIWHIFVSKAWDATYLLHDQWVGNCLWNVKDAYWEIKFLVYSSADWIVVYDYQKSELFHIPCSTFYGIETHDDCSWVKTDDGKHEKLTVLETRHSVSISKYIDPKWDEEYSRFQKVHHIDNSNDTSLVSHWGVEYTVTQDSKQSSNKQWDLRYIENWEKQIIRRKNYERLISIPDKEEIFFCNWDILDVIVTDFDTFVIYSQEFYDETKRNGISRYTMVYSVDKQAVILKINDWDTYDTISNNDNFIVVHYTKDDVWFYNFRDGFSCNWIVNLDITTSPEPPYETYISFKNKENWAQFFYCTDYSTATVERDPETNLITSVEMWQKNTH